MLDISQNDIYRHPLLGWLLDLVWPMRCVGCEALGALLCPDCEEQLPRIEPSQACPRCGAPYGALICTECYSRNGQILHSYQSCVSAFEYLGAAQMLIRVYKDQHERRLSSLCASAALQSVPKDWWDWADLLTYIPSSQNRIRQRGFDHMRLMAERLGELGGIGCQQLLAKADSKDQRGLNRSERTANLASAFSCPQPDLAKERNVLLLDDVCTTTATLEAASQVLLSAGAKEVRCVTVCRVY